MNINVRLDAALYDDARALAQSEERSVSQIVRLALRSYVADEHREQAAPKAVA